MKERPILFSAPMVRALLDGSKTQTRRIAKEFNGRGDLNAILRRFPNQQGCPYGQPGDRLWVRETWAQPAALDPGPTVYRADYPACVPPGYTNIPPAEEITWKPSIHMFRKDSRILLEIVSVRVERLQDISRKDAAAEGLHRYEHVWRDAEYPLDDIAYEPAKGWPTRYSCPIQAYQALWESINGAGSWDANPWVWVVEFRLVTP